MSRRKFERRRSRYRIWYALGVTYCWSFFLNLALFVLRIGYIDTGPDSADPDVAVWQVPGIPILTALVGAGFYSVMWLLLALGFADVVARLSHAIRHPGPSIKSVATATKEYGSSWIFEPSLTCSNALRRVQHPGFSLVTVLRSHAV
jgi:hypothetical protein